MKTIKEQADEYVDMFAPYLYFQANKRRIKNATHCAIIHVEGLTNENELGNVPHTAERWIELNIVLKELKSRI